MMRNWWHRLWCRDCRDVRPFTVVVYPNDLPLYVPFKTSVHWTPPMIYRCRTARTRAEENERAAFQHLRCLTHYDLFNTRVGPEPRGHP